MHVYLESRISSDLCTGCECSLCVADGRLLLASASQDKTLRIWSIQASASAADAAAPPGSTDLTKMIARRANYSTALQMNVDLQRLHTKYVQLASLLSFN